MAVGEGVLDLVHEGPRDLDEVLDESAGARRTESQFRRLSAGAVRRGNQRPTEKFHASSITSHLTQ